jgi:heme/copper-type cytochrome/quinol oxidase subunit 2
MDNSTDNSTNIVSTGLGTIANDTYSYINNLLSNPSVIIILVIVLILYIILFMSLGDSDPTSSSDNVSNSGSGTITILLVSFFIILVIINGLQYFFGVDILQN